jgi:hypothetical protein
MFENMVESYEDYEKADYAFWHFPSAPIDELPDGLIPDEM